MAYLIQDKYYTPWLGEVRDWHSNGPTTIQDGLTKSAPRALQPNGFTLHEKVVNFKGKIKAVVDATGPYETLRAQTLFTRRAVAKGWLTNPQAFGGYTYFTSMNQIPSPAFLNPEATFPYDSTVDTEAVRKLHKKLRDLTSRIETPTFLATTYQGKLYLEDKNYTFATRVLKQNRLEYKIYRNHRFVRRNSYSAFIKAIAEIRLGWAFGLAPDIADIQDAQMRLKMPYHDTFSDVRTTSVRQSIYIEPPSFRTIGLNAQLAYNQTARLITTSRRGYILHCRPTDPFKDSFAFDSKGIAAAIWEVVPWSFLVNYFFDVQGFIQQEQNCDWELKWGNTSRALSHHETTRWQPVKSSTSNRSVQVSSAGTFTARYNRLKREKVTVLPTYIPRLHFADALSEGRILNLASLIVTKFLPW